MYYHLVARTFGENAPFTDPEKAYWLWHRLKAAFPNALAAMLMPNHIHFVLKSSAPHEDRVRLARILGRFTTVFGEKPPFWQPVPEPALIVDADKLRRDIRYVLLNPCRARLCKDPLEWKWSTYRGSVGAAVDPWVSQRSLTAALGGGNLAFVHRYISSDPSVAVIGTALPAAALPSKTPQRSLAEIAAAAYAATEVLSDLRNLQRRNSKTKELFIRLACQQGWSDAGVLAQFMQIPRSTVWKFVQREKSKDCLAGALCLGDVRLRR